MAIEVICDACGHSMMLMDHCAGKRGLCPHCKAVLSVPAVVPVATPPEEFVAPTERQIAYAQKLGISVASGISRRELSDLIDGAKDVAPATESQKEFLRDLGVSFPPDIKVNQISLLLDAATKIRAEVTAVAWKQIQDSGQFVAEMSDQQLLAELSNRGKRFFIFTLLDDEFRYRDVPMKGELKYSHSMNLADAQYIISNLATGWACELDGAEYVKDFDGKAPNITFELDEIPFEGRVVSLSLKPSK